MRRLNADSTMPTSTSARSRHNGRANGDAAAVEVVTGRGTFRCSGACHSVKAGIAWSLRRYGSAAYAGTTRKEKLQMLPSELRMP